MLQAALFVILAGTSVLAVPFDRPTPRTCGSALSSADVARFEADFHARLAQHPVPVDAISTFDAVVNVHWHVISSGDSLEEGNIPDSQIEGSITAMNEHFAGSGLSFALASSDRTTNAQWFAEVGPWSPMQTEMKETLRIGTEADLNVYTVGFESGSGAGLLGYATFPASFSGNPKDDGVVILYSSVVNGTTPNYNEGKTLTHEVGHWVGLYHVFQGGCGGDGDGVSDTPPQSEATFGCPTEQDSCPGGGVDSIHNFMDYSFDPCMTEFTPGQIERFKSQLLTYRGITV